jgi:hypothetical protein
MNRDIIGPLFWVIGVPYKNCKGYTHTVDQFLDTKTNTNLYTKVPSKYLLKTGRYSHFPQVWGAVGKSTITKSPTQLSSNSQISISECNQNIVLCISKTLTWTLCAHHFEHHNLPAGTYFDDINHAIQHETQNLKCSGGMCAFTENPDNGMWGTVMFLYWLY